VCAAATASRRVARSSGVVARCVAAPTWLGGASGAAAVLGGALLGGALLGGGAALAAGSELDPHADNATNAKTTPIRFRMARR
jgi:hypothetical protein